MKDERNEEYHARRFLILLLEITLAAVLLLAILLSIIFGIVGRNGGGIELPDGGGDGGMITDPDGGGDGGDGGTGEIIDPDENMAYFYISNRVGVMGFDGESGITYLNYHTEDDAYMKTTYMLPVIEDENLIFTTDYSNEDEDEYYYYSSIPFNDNITLLTYWLESVSVIESAINSGNELCIEDIEAIHPPGDGDITYYPGDSKTKGLYIDLLIEFNVTHPENFSDLNYGDTIDCTEKTNALIWYLSEESYNTIKNEDSIPISGERYETN